MSAVLYAQVVGSGLPIIVLHGLFGSSDNLKLLQRLANSQQRFEFHFVDLRNHGYSPKLDSMLMADLAADIERYCQHKKIQDFALIGHSLGGKVAMATAMLMSERVRFLVVMDMAPNEPPVTSISQQHKPIFEGLEAVERARLSSRQEVNQLLQNYVESELVRQFLGKSLTRNNGVEFSWLFDYQRLRRSQAQWLAYPLDEGSVFSGKSCFIYGLQSDTVGYQQQCNIFKHFPSAHLIGIEAGHWLHAEQPQLFLQNLEGFLVGVADG